MGLGGVNQCMYRPLRGGGNNAYTLQNCTLSVKQQSVDPIRQLKNPARGTCYIDLSRLMTVSLGLPFYLNNLQAEPIAKGSSQRER